MNPIAGCSPKDSINSSGPTSAKATIKPNMKFLLAHVWSISQAPANHRRGQSNPPFVVRKVSSKLPAVSQRDSPSVVDQRSASAVVSFARMHFLLPLGTSAASGDCPSEQQHFRNCGQDKINVDVSRRSGQRRWKSSRKDGQLSVNPCLLEVFQGE